MTNFELDSFFLPTGPTEEELDENIKNLDKGEFEKLTISPTKLKELRKKDFKRIILRQDNAFYRQQPKYKEYFRKYMREYVQRPEVKKRVKEYEKEHNKIPEVREARRIWRKNYYLKNKKVALARNKKYYSLHKGQISLQRKERYRKEMGNSGGR